MPKMHEQFSASLRRDFAGRHDGPSMARPGSIGRPAQSTPKIPQAPWMARMPKLQEQI